MSNSTILELSRLNGVNIDDDNKAVWMNHMKEGVPINSGDQISLRASFINVDEKQSTDIVIPPTGQTLSLTFGYYEYYWDPDNRTNIVTGPVPNPDYLPHVIYTDQTQEGTLQQVKLDVLIADYSWTNKPFKFTYQTKDGTTHTSSISTSYNEGIIKDITFDINIDDVIADSVVWINPRDAPFYDGGLPAVTFNAWLFGTLNPVGHPHLKQGTVVVHLEGGTYDPPSLAKHITDKMQELNADTFNGNTELTPSNQFLIRSYTGGAPKGEKLRAILPGETDTDVGYFIGDTNPEWVGASQVSLVYGSDAGLGDLFAIQYMHTPFFEARQISVLLNQDPTSNVLTMVPQQTGIFLIDIQPRTFWDNIGFDTTHLINLSTGPDPNNIKYVPTVAELNRVITRGYLGMQTLFPDGNRVITDLLPTAQTYIASPVTDMLLGTAPNLTPQGHYLIEISFGGGAQSYIFPSGSLSHIFGIVSSNYLENGFVTGYADSGIPYIHQGTPFTINQMRVRILDPITKEEITSLGNNSSLYLQIDRAINTATSK